MTRPAVLVTGGSRGIGRAIVTRLVDDGYEVINFSRCPPADLLPHETFTSVDLAEPDAGAPCRAGPGRGPAGDAPGQ